LGNPGGEYAGTRHNVGADVVAMLAERHGGRLKMAKREHSLADDVKVAGHRVALAFPQTYMNDSGRAVRALMRRSDIDDAAQVVIVHDELDLPTGRVRVKQAGGLAGHNGLRSVKDHLKTDEFLRVRIGIGKPPGKAEGANHVLKKPTKAEREELAIAVQEAADAIEMIVDTGVARAMNRYNTSPNGPSENA
jgi:PTH1 family peptidyl-tRNA hydrolase